jgi:hypothetical protein
MGDKLEQEPLVNNKRKSCNKELRTKSPVGKRDGSKSTSACAQDIAFVIE